MTSNIFLDNILQSIELIEDYTKDINNEEFLGTDFIQESAIRRIKIIGESIKNLQFLMFAKLSLQIFRKSKIFYA